MKVPIYHRLVFQLKVMTETIESLSGWDLSKIFGIPIQTWKVKISLNFTSKYSDPFSLAQYSFKQKKSNQNFHKIWAENFSENILMNGQKN